MKQLGWLICRTFIEKKKKESKTTLFSFLPRSEQEILQNLAAPYQHLESGFDLKNEILAWTHYSWLLPFLRSFPEKEVILFLSSLEKATAEKIKNSLKFSSPFLPLSKEAKGFCKQKMAQFLLPENTDLLPLKALPRSPLTPLLDLNSQDLHFIIELLGLHDLAVELKQIIDNTKLKKIYSIFPKEKEAFLKMLAHKKETVVFRRIEISRWDEKAESLLGLLFQRGLNRLAKALYPENSHFIWYIKHRMNTEDAQSFTSLCKNLEHPKAYSFLSKQVLEAISFLQKITINPPTSS